jgi:hypothetical protein
MKNKVDIKVFSQSDNIRLYIIEHSLHIETLIAEAIGSLLGINYKKSKSFGFSSSSLSFNQKILIVQDIKGIESEMAKKLTCLMNIRNKFAHVQEINSFESLFEIASNGTQIKNQIESWYNLEDKNEDDDVYKFLFFKLAEEITQMLMLLQVKERLSKSVLKMEKEYVESNLQSYREVISEKKNSQQINDEVFKRTIEKLPHLSIQKKIN